MYRSALKEPVSTVNTREPAGQATHCLLVNGSPVMVVSTSAKLAGQVQSAAEALKVAEVVPSHPMQRVRARSTAWLVARQLSQSAGPHLDAALMSHVVVVDFLNPSGHSHRDANPMTLRLSASGSRGLHATQLIEDVSKYCVAAAQVPTSKASSASAPGASTNNKAKQAPHMALGTCGMSVALKRGRQAVVRLWRQQGLARGVCCHTTGHGVLCLATWACNQQERTHRTHRQGNAQPLANARSGSTRYS